MKYNSISLFFILFIGLVPLIWVTVLGQDESPVEQTYVLMGFGGKVFGLAQVEADGRNLSVHISTPYVPSENREFEAWLIDDLRPGSGYYQSLGPITQNGTLSYENDLMNPYTFTHITVTSEPANDLDPRASTSNTQGILMLAPPFRQ